MRVIFEEVYGEYFFELVLDQEDTERFRTMGSIIADFVCDHNGARTINVFIRNEDEMPLVKGKAAKSKKGFSENVKKEMEAGKPQAQSLAIAYSQARKAGKKSEKK